MRRQLAFSANHKPQTEMSKPIIAVRDLSKLYRLAAALESGVNAFVTLDEDFLRVEGIIVYTTAARPHWVSRQ